MKYLILIITLLSFIACGKKTKNDSSEIVTTTPGINTNEPNEAEWQNSQFTAQLSKTNFNKDEVIVLKIINSGKGALNHHAFRFAGNPNEIQVNSLNCFDILTSEESCHFSVVIPNGDNGEQEINIHYTEYEMTNSLKLKVNLSGYTDEEPVEFLYGNTHTLKDCTSAEILNKKGEVVLSGGKHVCSFRGTNYYAESTTEILENPLEIISSGSVNASEHFCPENWLIKNFKFASSTVIEKKNFFGGTREVTIPPGESREVCVKHGLFKCSEKKVFYSRLVKVECY